MVAYDQGYSRRSSSEREIQPVAVVAVDPVTRTATAVTRTRHSVRINCAHATGDTITVPAVGEQWYCERFDGEWRLYNRIPFNDATLNLKPEEGQVSVGSARGPLELNGTEARVNAEVFRLNGVYYRDDGTSLQRSTDRVNWGTVSAAEADGLVATISEALAGAGAGVEGLRDWGAGVSATVGSFNSFWEAACANPFLGGLRAMGRGGTDAERVFDGLQRFADYLTGVVFPGAGPGMSPLETLSNARDLLRPLASNKFFRGLAEIGEGRFLLDRMLAGLVEFAHLVNELVSCSEILPDDTVTKLETLFDAISGTAMTPATVLRDLYDTIWSGTTLGGNPLLAGLVDLYRALAGIWDQGGAQRNFLRDAAEAAGRFFTVLQGALSCDPDVLDGVDVALLTGDVSAWNLTVTTTAGGDFTLNLSLPGDQGWTSSAIPHDSDAQAVLTAIEQASDAVPGRCTVHTVSEDETSRVFRVVLAGGASTLTVGSGSALVAADTTDTAGLWPGVLPAQLLRLVVGVFSSLADNPFGKVLVALYDGNTGLFPDTSLPALLKPLKVVEGVVGEALRTVLCLTAEGGGAPTEDFFANLTATLANSNDTALSQSPLRWLFVALDQVSTAVSSNPVVKFLGQVFTALNPDDTTTVNLLRPLAAVSDVLQALYDLVLCQANADIATIVGIVQEPGQTPTFLQDIFADLADFFGLFTDNILIGGLKRLLADFGLTAISTVGVGQVFQALEGTVRRVLKLARTVFPVPAFWQALLPLDDENTAPAESFWAWVDAAPADTTSNLVFPGSLVSFLGGVLKWMKLIDIDIVTDPENPTTLLDILVSLLKTMIGITSVTAETAFNGILSSFAAANVTAVNLLASILSALGLVPSTSYGTFFDLLKTVLKTMIGITNSAAETAFNSILSAFRTTTSDATHPYLGVLASILIALGLVPSGIYSTPFDLLKTVLTHNTLIVGNNWASGLVTQTLVNSVTQLTDFVQQFLGVGTNYSFDQLRNFFGNLRTLLGWSTAANSWTASAQNLLLDVSKVGNGIIAAGSETLLQLFKGSNANWGTVKTLFAGFNDEAVANANSIIGKIVSDILGAGYFQLSQLSALLTRMRNLFGGNLTLADWIGGSWATGGAQWVNAANGFMSSVLSKVDDATIIQSFNTAITISTSFVYQLMMNIAEAIQGFPVVGAPVAETLRALTNTLFGNFTQGQRGFIQSGDNLLSDPKVQVNSFWPTTVPGLSIVPNSTLSRSTPQCLSFASTAGSPLFDITRSDLGYSFPIATAEGRMFFVECYVRGSVGTSTVSIEGHVLRLASFPVQTVTASTLASITATNIGTASAPSASISSGTGWTRLYGYFLIPSAPSGSPYDGFVVKLRSTAGTTVLIDDMMVKDVTEAWRTNTILFSSPTPASGDTVDASAVANLSNTYVSLGMPGGATSGTQKVPPSSVQNLPNSLQSLFGSATGATASNQQIQLTSLPPGVAGAAGVGSGINLFKTQNTFSTQQGANYIPGNFYDSFSNTSDLSLINSGNSSLPLRIQVSESGWYLVEIGYQLRGANSVFGFSWNLTPIVYKINSGATLPPSGAWGLPYKYGNSVSYNVTGQWGGSFAQNSFTVYLDVGQSVVPGYLYSPAPGASGAYLNNVIVATSAGGAGSTYGYGTYCSVSLINRSLN